MLPNLPSDVTHTRPWANRTKKKNIQRAVRQFFTNTPPPPPPPIPRCTMIRLTDASGKVRRRRAAAGDGGRRCGRQQTTGDDGDDTHAREPSRRRADWNARARACAYHPPRVAVRRVARTRAITLRVRVCAPRARVRAQLAYRDAAAAAVVAAVTDSRSIEGTRARAQEKSVRRKRSAQRVEERSLTLHRLPSIAIAMTI